MDMRHEPVRIPGYVALVAAMLVAGLSAFVAGGPIAGVIAALGVIVPGAAGVETARSHAWSPASVEAVTYRAALDPEPTQQGGTLESPEHYLSEHRAGLPAG